MASIYTLCVSDINDAEWEIIMETKININEKESKELSMENIELELEEQIEEIALVNCMKCDVN